MKGVLIVDDEFAIVDSMTELLTWAGYTVSSARNGEAGMEELARARPALVILDYMMPVMDGLGMLRAMRADAAFAKIPVILMTAAPRALPLKDKQWNALLAKPFDATELLETIEALVGRA